MTISPKALLLGLLLLAPFPLRGQDGADASVDATPPQDSALADTADTPQDDGDAASNPLAEADLVGGGGCTCHILP